MTEQRVSLRALELALANGAHSIFSASGSPMWARCSGSLIPNLLALDTSGYEAAEGTVAHNAAEVWLKRDVKPKHLLNTVQTVYSHDKKFEIPIDDAMLDEVQRYVDWCWSLDGDKYVERKVYFTDLTPIQSQGGTMDHGAFRWLHGTVTDLKYGKGIQVDAKDNYQLMLYAYGAFVEWDFLYNFQTITMRIAQPRMGHFDEHTVTRAELLEFAEWIKGRAHAAWQLDAPRTPGVKQCSFCKVKATCGAHIAFQDALMHGDLEGLGSPITGSTIAGVKDNIDWMKPFREHRPLAELTTEQMSVLFQYKGFVESWWKSLGAELLRRVGTGDNAPLQKMVEGKTRRVYQSQSEAKRYLIEELGIPAEEVIIESVLSPSQVEKLLPKHGFERKDVASLLAPVIFKPRGKPTLAAISDRRPPLDSGDDDVFRDLTTPETPETEED